VLAEKKPSDWQRLRFDRVVVRSKESGRPSWEPLSVFLGDGVVRRSSRDDNHNQLGANLSNYLAVRPGDIVFNKLRTWQGGLGVSRYQGIVSPAYFVCRPRTETDSGYFHYLLRSHIYLSELTRLSKFMPPSQFDIAWDDLRTLPVLVPPVDEQQVIADYLDTETARIDALITKKRRMIELLDERAGSVRDEWYGDLARKHGMAPLRRYVSTIEQGWSPVCDAVAAEPHEWGVLKTSAVSTGVFRPDENKRLPGDVAPDLRWTVGDGDLLTTRGSGSHSMVAKTCVARPGSRKLTISDLIYRLKLTSGDPDFVAAALLSTPVRTQIESSIRTDVGQTLKVRRDDIADLRVPSVPGWDQTAAYSSLADELDRIRAGADRLTQQVGLIAEHRQALITAAVTGELEIPVAA